VLSSTSGVSVGIGDRVNLIGSAHDDEISGSAMVNVLFGGGGSDQLFGGGASDTLSSSTASGDQLFGGIGTDTITGGVGLDSIFGGADSDFIYESSDVLNKDDGGVLFGGSGNDLIDVSASVDQSNIHGGSGNDTLIGNGASILYGGSGADQFRIETESTIPGANGDRIVGTEAADTLWINGIQVTEDNPDIIYGIEGSCRERKVGSPLSMAQWRMPLWRLCFGRRLWLKISVVSVRTY
jgi:Ca2+-binding RTX toxin-like protein